MINLWCINSTWNSSGTNLCTECVNSFSTTCTFTTRTRSSDPIHVWTSDHWLCGATVDNTNTTSPALKWSFSQFYFFKNSNLESILLANVSRSALSAPTLVAISISNQTGFHQLSLEQTFYLVVHTENDLESMEHLQQEVVIDMTMVYCWLKIQHQQKQAQVLHHLYLHFPIYFWLLFWLLWSLFHKLHQNVVLMEDWMTIELLCFCSLLDIFLI